ncbi:MAG: flagellar motor protein, partial [Phototrophicales bacterium]
HLDSLFNGPAAIIVIGGTFAATLLQTSLGQLKRALTMLKWVFVTPYISKEEGIEKVVSWSMRARKEGLLGLEAVAEKEKEAYAAKGLQLLIDGVEPEAMRNILELDLISTEKHDLTAAKVYDAMGGYAPTIGIIGAVMGLIHVMSNLADPASLGSGIATAFVATIYGVALANLLFFPIGAKLKSIVMEQSHYRELLVEGLVSIAEGENPRAIELKLKGFI